MAGAETSPDGQVAPFSSSTAHGGRQSGCFLALLADRLGAYRGVRSLVVGVPRGAVPMARIIAAALQGDVDVVLVRKLRAPWQPELAIGAVDEAGRVQLAEYADIASKADIREEIRTQQEILRKRRMLYSEAQPAIDPAGRVVILVDDGAADDADTPTE